MKGKLSLSVLSLVLLTSGSDHPSAVYEDAVAVWHFSDLDDRAGINSRLINHGDVSFVRLEGDEAALSKQRGNGGSAAYFDGSSWLDAGQGAQDELNLSGKEITLYARIKAGETKDYAPILTKAGNDESLAYSIALVPDDGSIYIEVRIGSDEIAGSHRLRYLLPTAELNTWQDIVFRFNGKISQLYVNGQLRDDEVTVGRIRDWNRKPMLIGPEYKTEYGYASVGKEALNATFVGFIATVALWDKSLSDRDIMQLSQVDALPDGRPRYYREKHRPQFHFSAKKNWLNDPNGLVYYDGTYHLFFQYMPPHRPGAYKDWGHAVSKDLIHWEQVSSHITPHNVWGGCWSGSAVVDVNNVAGFQTGSEKSIIAFITNGGNPNRGLGPLNTQCLAYSTDGGNTFTYYDQNPVIKHIKAENRDPKVVWDEASQQYIMSLFMDAPDEFALFGSTDLKTWNPLSTLSVDGVIECPGFQPLPLDGNKGNQKWLFFGANGDYVIGHFDGKAFMPETEVMRGDYGTNYYAAMTWSNMPDNRCVSIAWMPTQRYPGMPFEQQMSFPNEVTLRSTPQGMKAFRYPIPEISSLYDKTIALQGLSIKGAKPLKGLQGEQYDMDFEFDISRASSFDLVLRDVTLSYDVKSQTLMCGGVEIHNPIIPKDWVAQTAGETTGRNNLGQAPLRSIDGKVKLRILLDHNTVEVFANGGEAVVSSCFMPQGQHKGYSIRCEGQLNILKGEIHSLKSIWASK